MVEFAVTLPIFLVMFLGIMYFGYAYYEEQQVQLATRYMCWKAGRHDPDHNLAAALSQANNVYSLDGAAVNGTEVAGSLQLLSGDNFSPNIFLSYPDPSGLPNPMSLFDFGQIAMMVGTGIAQVDSHYQVTVSQPINTSALPQLSATQVNRAHEVVIGNWEYDEIEGDLLIYGYEAYLDYWAYDELSNISGYFI